MRMGYLMKKYVFAITTSLILFVSGCGVSSVQSSDVVDMAELGDEDNDSNAVIESDQSISVSNSNQEASTKEEMENTTAADKKQTLDGDNTVADGDLSGYDGEMTSDEYSAEDVERMFKNYLQSELTNIDISKIEIDVSLSEGFYWIDSFEENDTDSLHPVKTGSAYVDPLTGFGRFWIWGWYDDPDAVEVNFTEYDY